MSVRIIPDKRQLEFLSWEFGIFFHFGIRSFYKGSRDWDGKAMDISVFNPTQLDCSAWLETIKQAGAKYAVLTTKHHDGFALWPSKYTEYSVANTPWKNGQGDVVREFTDACRAHDIKVGLYYSPAQWGEGPSLQDKSAYDDYFVNQITELLTQYGQIDYLWFDACGSENHVYDKARIIHTIRELQKDILVFNMWDPDVRWIGNEEGYAWMPNSNIMRDPSIEQLLTNEKQLDWVRFLPGECDMKMRSEWFDCADNEDTIKSLDDLLGMYELSVGRGANLLLNIGPEASGLLPKKDEERLLEFGRALKQRRESRLSSFARNGEALTADEINLVNCVVLQEDLTQGESITSFRILADASGVYGPVCVYIGATVGYQAICRFPAIRTNKIILEVMESTGEYIIKTMEAFFIK